MSKYFIFLLMTLVISNVLDTAQSQDCSVALQSGTILGAVTGTDNPDRNVCAYTAIPYANPPVGALRFQAPQAVAPWEETLNATYQPNWCPQSGTPPEGIQMTEDCLYLNVYQPLNVNSTANLPVMIWFHGGSFFTGSSILHTPTKLLARGDVILVAVHYRLGLLGFLSTGDAEVPGNNGLKDQAFSIRWVNENIEAFGGNPNNVTIFGESAGGASVLYQMLSPLNKGLIHAVIAQSGTPLAFWALDRNPIESAKTMATRLNCPVDNGTSYMVSCLRQVPWQNIVTAQTEHYGESSFYSRHPFATVTPVIEPPGVPGAFITDEPVNVMKTGDIPNIPVLLGANKHDGSLSLALKFLSYFEPRNLYQNAEYMKHEIVLDILNYYNVPETDPGNRVLASSVELAYLSGVNRSSWDESMPGLVDMESVFRYKASVQNTAEILSARNRNVYLYSFEHHSNNSLWSRLLGDDYSDMPIQSGISHGDDLMYIFEYGADFSEEDRVFSAVMCDLWLNFAKFGNPTPVLDERFDNWIPYNSLDEPYLKLNLTPNVQYGYRNSWRPNGFEWA